MTYEQLNRLSSCRVLDFKVNLRYQMPVIVIFWWMNQRPETMTEEQIVQGCDAVAILTLSMLSQCDPLFVSHGNVSQAVSVVSCQQITLQRKMWSNDLVFL